MSAGIHLLFLIDKNRMCDVKQSQPFIFIAYVFTQQKNTTHSSLSSIWRFTIYDLSFRCKRSEVNILVKVAATDELNNIRKQNQKATSREIRMRYELIKKKSLDLNASCENSLA